MECNTPLLYRGTPGIRCGRGTEGRCRTLVIEGTIFIHRIFPSTDLDIPMPTLDLNRKRWDGEYAWSHGGDDWSGPWGSVEMQWFGTLFPRIHRFLPAARVLEIAPGFGRWTQYLLTHCNSLDGVDLSAECIDACSKRFASAPHARFYVGDGSTLPMIPDEIVDFCFSFDSLVHAEIDVMGSYLREMRRTLTSNGVAILHHSNLGAHRDYLAWAKRLHRLPRGADRLTAWGLLDPIDIHWRAESVSAESIARLASEADLCVVGQELINWRNTHRTLDCITTFAIPGGHFAETRGTIQNAHFADEAAQWARVSPLYSDHAGPN